MRLYGVLVFSLGGLALLSFAFSAWFAFRARRSLLGSAAAMAAIGLAVDPFVRLGILLAARWFPMTTLAYAQHGLLCVQLLLTGLFGVLAAIGTMRLGSRLKAMSTP